MSKVGIDFGTTNSVLIAYDKNNGEFSYFSYKDKVPCPVSSTVWYGDFKPKVGSDARSNMLKLADVPGNYFERSIKSKLGKDYEVNILGKNTKGYEIASTIINHIKNQAKDVYKAEDNGVNLDMAIFTIPINFDGKAREDLRKAAKEADIHVVTFIHEPFAAIIGYYFTKFDAKNAIKEMTKNDDIYSLVFDWGGGTLDITIVKNSNGRMEEVGIAELTNEAGDKFDEMIVDYIWSKYIDTLPKYKYTLEALEKAKKAKIGRLIAIAEDVKIELSTHEKANFLLENVIKGESTGINYNLTKEEFAQIINNTIEKAYSKIDDALKAAGINENKISLVLPTGGTCRIPAVIESLNKKFGHRVVAIDNGDLIIAQGAAVICEMGWLPFLTKDIMIELCDDSYYKLYEKGNLIAVDKTNKKKEVFKCVDQTNKIAKVIVSDGRDGYVDSRLAIINVDILGHNLFGDDILVDSEIDENIILNVKTGSQMVLDIDDSERYGNYKHIKIHNLCFGLEIKG